MPSAYKENQSTVSVRSWRAAKTIQCFNNYGEAPLMVFSEVERVSVDDELKSETFTGRRLEIGIAQGGAVIPWINPETYEQILDENGDPVPGMSFTDEEFAFMVACVYINVAVKQDKQDAINAALADEAANQTGEMW